MFRPPRRYQWSFGLEVFVKDFIFAGRVLRKNPAFAATAVLTLAIGIGGNTAIFSVIRAVLLRPLAYREPDRLIYFSMNDSRRDVQDGAFSLTRLEEMRMSARSFTEVGAFLSSPENITISGGGEPEALKGTRFRPIFWIFWVSGRSSDAALPRMRTHQAGRALR